MPNLGVLNRMDDASALECFIRCCGSVNWAKQMVAGRPYAHISDLLAQASRAWRELSAGDCLEAFAAHPQIAGSGVKNAWSLEEQTNVSRGSSQVLKSIREGNRRYYEKFGFVFLICASNRSAEEILSNLCVRLENSRQQEIDNASNEQQQITKLRLEKLLGEP